MGEKKEMITIPLLSFHHLSLIGKKCFLIVTKYSIKALFIEVSHLSAMITGVSLSLTT